MAKLLFALMLMPGLAAAYGGNHGDRALKKHMRNKGLLPAEEQAKPDEAPVNKPAAESAVSAGPAGGTTAAAAKESNTAAKAGEGLGGKDAATATAAAAAAGDKDGKDAAAAAIGGIQSKLQEMGGAGMPSSGGCGAGHYAVPGLGGKTTCVPIGR